MNNPQIDRVRRVFSDVFQLPLDQVSEQSSPETIPTWDSLQHLNLVLALEQEFRILFTPEEVELLLSVEVAAGILQEKGLACEVS